MCIEREQPSTAFEPMDNIIGFDAITGEDTTWENKIESDLDQSYVVRELDKSSSNDLDHTYVVRELDKSIGIKLEAIETPINDDNNLLPSANDDCYCSLGILGGDGYSSNNVIVIWEELI